jgi:hypothetical protein
VCTFAKAESDAAAAAGESPHQHLDRLAESVPPGADGLILLPYFLGEKTPIHDPYARGTLVGLGLHHTIGHIWRAALEAVVFGFRHHVAVFEELGQSVRRVVASDGGAESRVWMQIAATFWVTQSSYWRVTPARAWVLPMSPASRRVTLPVGTRSRGTCARPAWSHQILRAPIAMPATTPSIASCTTASSPSTLASRRASPTNQPAKGAGSRNRWMTFRIMRATLLS